MNCRSPSSTSFIHGSSRADSPASGPWVAVGVGSGMGSDSFRADTGSVSRHTAASTAAMELTTITHRAGRR